MAERDPSLDTAVDDLYTADLDQFVARRDELARARRASGDREGATAVKQLRKPSRVAWAVNQAVRHAPERLDAVLDAGRALRDAQQRALREGTGTGLHDAMRTRQRAVRALADIGVDALGSAGDSAREAIEQTLNAASIDDGAAAAVRGAQLTQELEPPDVFSTLEVGAGRPAPAPATRSERQARPRAEEAAAKPRRVDRAAVRRAEQAERAARAARDDAEQAERDHEQAKAHADDLAREARAAAQAADDARDAAREAATRARESRRAAEQAEKEARRARAAAGD